MTSIDSQQLQFLHQIQNHTLSNTHAFLFLIAYSIPVPLDWKFSIYHFLLSLPIPELSAGWITILIVVGPVLSLGLLVFIGFILIKFVKLLVSLVLSFMGKSQTQEKKIYLELTFPADTSKSAYATQQLYSLIHNLARQKTFKESLFRKKAMYSLEIVSTKKEGIRYILVTSAPTIDILKRSLLSYLPGIKIREIQDYLSIATENSENQTYSVLDMKLSSHFALPLNKQDVLSQHDPISYLTGSMTKLSKNDLIAFQVITTPVMNSLHQESINNIQRIKHTIAKTMPLTPLLFKGSFTFPSTILFIALPMVWVFIVAFKFLLSIPALLFNSSGDLPPLFQSESKKAETLLDPYEQELAKVVKEKIEQPLFETSIRILVKTDDTIELETRLSGLLASFGQLSSSFQSFTAKGTFLGLSFIKQRFTQFQQRILSPNTFFNQNPILSVSEITDLYHFPYTDTTKTENMVKEYSKELPAPLSLKNGKELDVVFAKNTYGGETTDVGLTDADRAKHMYIIGQTGSGKSTIMYHMIKQDIQKGRGVCIVDPHGDLAKDLLLTIPEERIDDCIYFNPFDLKHPVGINLLELPDDLEEDERELEQEVVAEGVISIFRRVFSNEEKGNAHRIEYILRNCIYTAFTVKDATIFTIYELLNNPDFQKKVTEKLEDHYLQDFWKYEFGRAGNYQVVKMVSGITAKVGRFLFSPTARRILEQPHSTINFDSILDEGLILICNLSEGNIGEDTTQLLGTTIITKIQQAAMRRGRTEAIDRKPFYLFVDEFQTFATTTFTKILSSGRKYGLRVTIAEQSTSQQEDQRIVNIILANTATVACFRTASPVDEELMLNQFAPEVTREDIVNLPNYRFYMKMSAIHPEEAFSAETLKIERSWNKEKTEKLITSSQTNFAITYQKPEKKVQVARAKSTIDKEEIDDSDDVSTL